MCHCSKSHVLNNITLIFLIFNVIFTYRGLDLLSTYKVFLIHKTSILENTIFLFLPQPEILQYLLAILLQPPPKAAYFIITSPQSSCHFTCRKKQGLCLTPLSQTINTKVVLRCLPYLCHWKKYLKIWTHDIFHVKNVAALGMAMITKNVHFSLCSLLH